MSNQCRYILLSSGEITPPWGVPLRGRLHCSGLPSSPGSRGPLWGRGLQPHPDQLEDAPVHHSDAHRRDAGYPLGPPHFPIRLWSVDAPYRFRRVGLGAQRLLDFVQEPLHTGFRRFHLLDRYAIHPGRALIGTYPFPTRFQHIAPIDPVVQHIKPELRFLLGLLAQLLSQQREFVWGSVSTRLFLQGFDMLPFFRSGNLFQAVLLSSYSSHASSEAPWLHGRYPASSLLWASPTPGQGRSLGYVFPRAVGGRLPFPALPGLPGSSTDLSLRACPQQPRKVRRVLAHCFPAGVRLHPNRADRPPPACLLYTSPSPRDRQKSRMPSS